MEFGRRLAIERDLAQSGVGIGNTAWDETGGFLLYPTMLGIKGKCPRKQTAAISGKALISLLSDSCQHGFKQGCPRPGQG